MCGNEENSDQFYFAFIFYLTADQQIIILQCTSAIGQLTKGRNKEDKERSELHSLSIKALEKDYSQRASDKLPLLASTLRSLKL